ncbi:MAG: hypothetical protein K6E37_04250 [Bacteroidales bacterium]|nr:hypothetical protein [Bacteroidales bacterium]
MKSAFLTILAAAGLCLTGCNLLNGLLDPDGYIDKWSNLVNETKHDAVVNGNTLRYGDHTYTVSGTIEYDFEPVAFSKAPTASVTFSNIPSGYNEFKAVYEGLLGKSLAGTAAMVPMALEIYARSSSTGEKCLALLCKDDVTVDGIIRVYRSKFVPSSAAGADDPYLQRYLPAALLKGAVYDNAYRPDEPYTVEIGPSANKPQETKMAPYGTVYFTYIYCDGWETRNRGVDIFLPRDETFYKVQGCSSCYVQCRTIYKGPWEGLK